MSSSLLQKAHPLLLPALAFCQFLLAIDYNIVLVALPEVGEQLGMSSASLQWVVSAYALAFGGLLIFGGRLGDVFGRRKLALLGILAFAVGSLAAAVAPTAAIILTGRALQGMGGAVLAPAILATIAVSFEEGPVRNRALALWSAAGGVGLALGSALGGILMQFFSWRAVFFLLVPLALIAFAGIWRTVPRHQPTAQRNSVDLPGGILAAVGVSAIVFALAELPVRGLDVTVGFAGLGGIALLAGFVVREAKAKQPLLDLSLFRSRALTGGLLAMLLFMGSIGTSYYVFTLFTQSVLQMTALETGLAFLPWGVVGLLAANLARIGLNRFGIRATLIIGLLVAAAGTAGLATALTPDSPVIAVIAWTGLLAIGQALCFATLFASAGVGVPPEQQGVASALMTTMQQVGTALGLAVLVGLATWTTRASDLAVADATASGLQTATMVGAGVLVVAAVCTAVVMPRRAR